LRGAGSVWLSFFGGKSIVKKAPDSVLAKAFIYEATAFLLRINS
jgi:hypothetical protein